MKTQPTTPKDLTAEVPSSKVLTYATVCSGIECMSVACRGLSLRPVFFSEIEPFPCAVLKAHYPDVPNLGDMSKISVTNKTEITNGITTITLSRPIDILAGGTPCQSVSVAGKGEGMREGSGTRSSLAFDFVRLARELRPRWIIWENVANVLSAKHAGDFLHFLANLGDCGYSLAWRVLDAQYVRVDGMERAVPQRRRRVWVVGYSGADESRAAEILFEPDCVAGHTAPRRRAGEGFAYALAGRDNVYAGMVEGAPGAGGKGEECGCLNSLDPMSKRVFAGGGAIHTLCSRAEGTGVNTPSVCIAIEGNGSRPSHLGSGVSDRGAQFTLNRIEQHGVAYESKCFENHGQDSRIKPIEVSDTRNQKDGTGGNNLPLVVFSKVSHPYGKNGDGERWDRREVAQTRNTFDNSEVRTQECVVSMAQNTRDELRIINGDGSIAGALPAEPGAKQQTYLVHRYLAAMRYIVRRLTPTECERLMGLPDGYTIPVGLDPNDPALVAEFQRIHDTFGAIMAEYEHVKPPKPKTAAQVQKWLAKITDPATCPDSPRYKACGNGWATNQPRWILCRLLAFDGIDPFCPVREDPSSRPDQP